MGYFPFFIDIKDKNFLVVGGGKVALRKIEKLNCFEPNIKVVAPKVCNEIYELSNKKRVEIFNRKFDFCDL